MKKSLPTIAMVTRETRLSKLKRKGGTGGAARFRMARAASSHKLKRRRSSSALEQMDCLADFSEYEQEAGTYDQALATLRADLNMGYPISAIDRSHVPNFDFQRCDVVVVAGPDGLVANVAKYAHDVPIIGVNPDPQRIDGVLLPFAVDEAAAAVRSVIQGNYRKSAVTLAKVTLNDLQQLYAFNDIFVGVAGHSSARYTLEIGPEAEAQCSSGVIISTGVGCSGWMSSICNMAAGIADFAGMAAPRPQLLARDERALLWAVREPFVSRQSAASMVMGRLVAGESLIVHSLMPSGGIIFSDGVESDFLEFDSGSIARIEVAEERALLVQATRRVGRRGHHA